MATAATVIFWGAPVHGRELKALQLFNEASQFYTRLKEKGEIESFEALVLDGFGDELNGFMVVRGEPEKLMRIQNSDERLRLDHRASLLLQNHRIGNASIGEGLKTALTEWTKHVKELV